MDIALDDLLKRAIEAGASDCHLKVGSPPVMRIAGELRRMQDLPVLRPADVEAYALSIFTPRAAEDFRAGGEADFAYGRPELGRFRVGVFRQRGSVSLVLRRVVPGVPSLDRLGLPPIVRKLVGEPHGLFLVTGPSGSGRTTTLAAAVEHINTTRPASIVTVEDPIEILFPDKMAVVAQREVGVDTTSFADAIRRAMRQDADVIMVSEVSDPETAAAVVAAAETGHLVLAAMHSTDPVDTLTRLIGYFPPAYQRMARTQVASALLGIVSQRLVDATDGMGLVLATEVLTANARVQEHIVKESPADTFLDVIKDSEFFGMQSFDQALLHLVKQRRVTVAAALTYVRNNHEFRAKVIEAGIDA
jgi:twitching motility protein PilT